MGGRAGGGGQKRLSIYLFFLLSSNSLAFEMNNVFGMEKQVNFYDLNDTTT